MNNIKQYILPSLITLSAITISACAAYYSVTGLSKLFAGATQEVILMASALEISKLVVASLLYQYWSKLNKILKTYLTAACTVLILITSMGIYGFLSSAYQETYSEYRKEIQKQDFYKEKVSSYKQNLKGVNEQIENTLENISNYSKAKSRKIQVRDTTTDSGYRTTVSNAELRIAQDRVKSELKQKRKLNQERSRIRDSIRVYKEKILSLDNNINSNSEIGPLIYLNKITGLSMDRITNVLLLVIIFVFDPLAISLVLAANFAFNQTSSKRNTSNNNKNSDDRDELKDISNSKQDTELNYKNSDEKEDVDKTFKPKQTEEYKEPKESPKVINTTKRNAQVLYPDGRKKWYKKKDIEDKIRYM